MVVDKVHYCDKCGKEIEYGTGMSKWTDKAHTKMEEHHNGDCKHPNKVVESLVK